MDLDLDDGSHLDAGQLITDGPDPSQRLRLIAVDVLDARSEDCSHAQHRIAAAVPLKRGPDFKFHRLRQKPESFKFVDLLYKALIAGDIYLTCLLSLDAFVAIICYMYSFIFLPRIQFFLCYVL